MSKPFFEVFSSLKLEPSTLHDIMEQTEVERVSTTRSKEYLRVYITCKHLIQKAAVWSVENAIKEQFFAGTDLKVKIYEHFVLSSQYTPQKLLEIYRDSILMELRESSNVLYIAFKFAEITYPKEGEILLTLEDSAPVRDKEEELVRILEKILVERCGFSVSVSVAYKEASEGKYKEEDEQKIRLLVDAVRSRMDNRKRGDEFLTAGGDEISAGRQGGRKGKEGRENVSAKEGATRAFYGRAGYGRADAAAKGGWKSDYKRTSSRDIKRSDNPDVLYGRDFEGESVRLVDLEDEQGEVIVRGKVISIDTKELKTGKTIYMFAVTDFTDTIGVKIFVPNENLEQISENIKVGSFVKVKGICMEDKFDKELGISSVAGIKKISDFTTTREDTAFQKRVELHCHTKMSDYDGVSDVKDIVKRAYAWNHRAIAITDHGVVQSFTEANHVWEDLWGKEKAKRKEAGEESPDKQDFFKILYGVEAYLVDDLQEIVTNDKGQSLQDDFVVFDIETTGLSPVNCHIIEIGAVKVSGGEIVDRYSTFVNPEVPIPFEIENLTGIRDDMVVDAPRIEEILPQFLEFCEGCVMVAHNANFDMSFIMENCRRFGLPMEFTYVDTVGIARVLLPELHKHTLATLSKELNISLENHHRAVDDAECTAHIFTRFIQMLDEQEVTTLAQVRGLGDDNIGIINKLHSYHAIILAKNDLGRINLYRLITESHLTYFHGKHPRIPKSLVMKYREGLLLGSACEAGELYSALVEGKSDIQIARLVNFYDYLEIQPVGNNAFMILSDKHPGIRSEEDIRDLNRRVVELGEQFHKPVVATCDVHFLDPEDEVYRRIIMAGRGFEDADNQAPLFLHTTEEMLEEFAYLGSEKAKEVVVTNTNMIADMIETISPVRPDKCPPVIPDSDKTLREICYNRAHELYGPDLPKIVEDRLERELNSIIGNGFAVMYIIAQKLVWKSVEDGYLVGSRGSVGSSFVATMAGITEINPLSPHYYCTKCHYVDFDSEEVKAYAGTAGIDMPAKVCPNCGEMLHKDGFDIPFETFLGFKGDKEPDIDLNFSGEYQSKAHKYTEVIFGAGQTYRAGTIATLAEKTAFGFVKKYYEDHEVHKRAKEIDRITAGCTGVRRSTGQHPGGIVVLPIGQDMNTFTPLQHPANDMETNIVTTHFDYHSIDHNLLKLDILGHDDPTMIRMLQDLTGLEPTDIPLDGPEVMSLFQNTDALGITPEQIGGTMLGCLGIPECGTDFAMNLIIEAQPKSFSDLVRVMGLSHGTNVWQGNAQDLIKDQVATISTCVCTRDDIMLYLIGKGMESEKSFKIMEAVRKGMVAKKKVKPEQWEAWKEDMLAHDVPDWYVDSCQKIEYMFPKAHAAAYVMMAWRIGYCKIHYPLEYYAAYFSIRAKAFSYALMCQGQKALENTMAEYRKRMDQPAGKDDKLSEKEEKAYADMRVVQEMYARGFEFLPIDLFKVKAREFQVLDGKLMPSLVSIEGLGEKVADSIVETAKDGPFLSREDFRERAKASKTITDQLAELGILGDIPESNQISLFDFR